MLCYYFMFIGLWVNTLGLVVEDYVVCFWVALLFIGFAGWNWVLGSLLVVGV